MKKVYLLAFLMTQLSVATPLSQKLYLRADGGVDFPVKTSKEKFRNSPMYGVGIGFKFNEILRADLNFQTRMLANTGTYSFNTTSDALFLNTYLNLTDYEEMTPYVNAGIGYGINKSKNKTTSIQGGSVFVEGDTSKGMLWNVGVGTTLRLHRNVTIDAGYKFISLGGNKLKNTGVIPSFPGIGGPVDLGNIKTHEIFCGLMINL